MSKIQSRLLVAGTLTQASGKSKLQPVRTEVHPGGFKIKFFLLAALAALGLVMIAAPVFGAEIFFETKSQNIQIGDEFEVVVFLNTENESINAIDGKIVFPKNFLEVKKIKDGNSIINFWIEKPKNQDGVIIFSGVTPGGFNGKNGLIFSAIFQSKQTGDGLIEIQDIKALLNDGQGTEAVATISNFQFVILEQASSFQPVVLERKDTGRPEAFEPIVASDPAMFEGKYFLVFAAQDKESGIDHYEIKEAREFRIWKWKWGGKNWVIGSSPYQLEDQKLESYIYVKAIDKNGNERVTVLAPQKPMPWYENYVFFVIIIIGLAIAVIVLKKIIWKK